MQQLLDLIVNEEMDKANELFHEIVVEKSRDIYENLIAKEDDDLEESDKDDEDKKEKDDEVEEGFGAEMPQDDAEEHDPAGALMHDTEVDADGEDGEEHDEFGSDEEGDSPATKDDIQDLEDALAELKAEFEALMGDEGSSDDSEDDDSEDDDSEDDDSEDDDSEDNPFGKEEDDESEDENEYEEMGNPIREYRETVGNDWNTGKQKEQGKNLGAGSGDNYPAPAEGRSPVSSGKGKPTTGATAANIAQSDKGEGEMSGTSTNADKGSRGLVGSTKGEFTKGVEKNIASSSKSSMKDGSKLEKNTAGHGAERKGGAPGPVGSGSGDKAGQTSIGAVKSPLNGAPNRNA